MKALTSASVARRRRRGATIYEVARHAGVSIATVSRAHRNADLVAPHTRDRVHRAIAALDYRPSRLGRSLAGGHHDAIGIVFPDLSGPYYSAVILGYEDASASQGRSVLILGTHRRPNAADQILELADRVDGLVVMSHTVAEEIVDELRRRDVPVVVIGRSAGVADSVRAENRNAMESLVRHLFAHGHERLAFVGDPAASSDAEERWDGFVAAHRSAGLDLAFEPVVCPLRELDGRGAVMPLLADRRPPTAVVGASDEIAMGVLEAARMCGIAAPAELAVTGWDDIPMTRHIVPALTTVRQPMTELGRRAAALLHERITTDGAEPRHEVLPTELVVRSSCGCNAATHRKEE